MTDDPFERAARREQELSRVAAYRRQWATRSRAEQDRVGMIVTVPLAAWVLMLLAGTVHHEFDLLRPIGYWPLLGIMAGSAALVRIIAGWIRA